MLEVGWKISGDLKSKVLLAIVFLSSISSGTHLNI